MKIYYIGSPEVFTEGASAIHVARMCEAFSKIGEEVTLMLPISSDRIDKFFSYYGIKKNFKIYPSMGFLKGPKRHFFHGVSSFFKVLTLDDYDCIVTRNITFAFLASYLKNNIIVDIHHPPVNLFSRIAIKRFVESKNILKIICNSEGTRNAIDKESNKKFQVLNNGVNIQDFKPNEEYIKFKNQLNIPIDVKVISYVGNTYKGRGIEKIIRLAKDYKNIYFLVIGGEKEDNLKYKRLITEERNIFFTNHVPHVEIPNYLMISDILLIPYDSDFTIKGDQVASSFSSPIKLFEYLSAKKPIIASDLPSFVSILKNNKNALLVNPDSYKEIKDSVQILLDNPEKREQLSNEAFELSKDFSWENRAKKILSGLK